jgi:hypothetical protein
MLMEILTSVVSKIPCQISSVFIFTLNSGGTVSLMYRMLLAFTKFCPSVLLWLKILSHYYIPGKETKSHHFQLSYPSHPFDYPPNYCLHNFSDDRIISIDSLFESNIKWFLLLGERCCDVGNQINQIKRESLDKNKSAFFSRDFKIQQDLHQRRPQGFSIPVVQEVQRREGRLGTRISSLGCLNPHVELRHTKFEWLVESSQELWKSITHWGKCVEDGLLVG